MAELGADVRDRRTGRQEQRREGVAEVVEAEGRKLGDNQELKRVLARAQRLLGGKIDVVGMDACLMTMIEVAYQLKDHAKVLVGSEELEPGPGWSHSAILADLTKHPKMTPPEIGATVVQRYVQAYRHGAEKAIDLGQIGDLVDAVDLLAKRILASIKNAALAAALHGARRRTLQFFEGLYVDLHRLAGNLATASGLSPITNACRVVQRVIQGQEGRSPVIAERHVGARLAPARGLSIYCPVYPMASLRRTRVREADRLGGSPGGRFRLGALTRGGQQNCARLSWFARHHVSCGSRQVEPARLDGAIGAS